MKHSLIALCILALIVLVCGCAVTRDDVQPTPAPTPVQHTPTPTPSATVQAPSEDANVTVIVPSRIIHAPDYNHANDKLTSDTYVFIEHHKTTHEIIEDNVANSSVPLLKYLPPMGNPYEFNENAKSLCYYMDFGYNNSTIAILGKSNSTDGILYSNMYQLYSIDKTPVEMGGIQVLTVYENGTACLRYNDESIILKPGDEWTNVTSHIEYTELSSMNATPSYYQNGSQKTENPIFKVNSTTVDSIRNYGISKKSDIRGGMYVIT